MRRLGQRGNQSGNNRRAKNSPPQGSLNDAFFGDFVDHGWRLLQAGQDEEATELAIRAVRMSETAASKALFVQCVKQWSYFLGAEQIQDLLARALTEPWMQPHELSGIVVGVLRHEAVLGATLDRVLTVKSSGTPTLNPLTAKDIDVLARNQLLLALLQTGKIADINLEKLLTATRAALLDISCRQAKVNETLLALACAIAGQCFFNEYVFDVSADEIAKLASLHDRIVEGISRQKEISALGLAVLGAYRSLADLAKSEELLSRRWPASVVELLSRQVRDVVFERKNCDNTPQLTRVENAVSVQVRAQYEQNPYPRWSRLPTAETYALSFDERFQREFPHSGYRRTKETPDFDVLIAGCGTGRQSILFAQQCPESRILAVDLSLASLAYAKRKTDGMGIGNVEYGQADILELGAINRSFDIISCCGVLHHLADPWQGWRTLVSLLRPDGRMLIGLYSEQARRAVRAAQNLLREHGYTASPDDIRRARKLLVELASQRPDFASLLEIEDFYTTSECRDLLFHVQETEVTLRQIETFLNDNDLRFLGFNMSAKSRALFAKRFGARGEANLDLWCQFEADNPHTFIGMYEFWVQRC